MSTRASEVLALKLRRPERWGMVLSLVVAGCGSTPDGMLAGGGGSDPAGAAGGVMSASGGSAVGDSGGSEPGGGAASGGAGGGSDSGGTSQTGGAANAGGGTTGTGGGASSGGAKGTGGCSGQGKIEFVATFDASVEESYRSGLATCVALAGELWSEQLVAQSEVTLEVLVFYDSSIPTANSRSTTTVAWDSANDIYELSAAYEIRTGIDPNGASVDIEMKFGTSLSDGTYWFDPEPTARTASIPAGKVDVLSTCGHELGHALAFSGARSASTGSLPGYSFLYDEHSTPSGGYYYFTGTEADAAYGGPVPENTQILDHLGNVSPAPGYDLDLDLMHGTPTRYQQRYYPTDVDFGILADLGLPVVGTPAAEAACSAPQARARASVKPTLGPTPAFVE